MLTVEAVSIGEVAQTQIQYREIDAPTHAARLVTNEKETCYLEM
jgi:hypothetical protein